MAPWESLAVELVKGLGVIAAVIGTIVTAKRQKATDASLATNHGKRPGEYLELIGDVVELARGLPTTEDMRRFNLALEEHTADDARSFAVLKASVDELAAMDDEIIEALEELRRGA